MGIGYAAGCLLSILLWKIDRQNIFTGINNFFVKHFKNYILINIFYLATFFIIFYLLNKIVNIQKPYNEIFNAITTFIAIDISNTERKNLNRKDIIFFYNSISCISRSLVCGFIAPIFYILLFGNAFGILYMVIYNFSQQELRLIKGINAMLNIIPALIAEVFLYIIYVYTHKSLKFKEKIDYNENIIARPLLNVDVMAAYIEDVNFYYYYTKHYVNYMKGFGRSKNKIDDRCIKSYLGIEYGICIVSFICFYYIVSVM
ncbi:MAG: hypothetical protein H7Y18_16520 [Clostridiaceae bacterium]|nr:hypothetical protein [Clostridiaceae bacterium]